MTYTDTEPMSAPSVDAVLSRPQRLRVASVQYLIRPVENFAGFASQVRGLVDAAAEYGCGLMVFPEYLTLQLLTIHASARDMPRQIRALAGFLPEYTELFAGLAAQHGMVIVAGSIPVVEGDDVFNDCYVFGPHGSCGVQGKLHMTRFEREDWGMRSRDELMVFEAPFGRLAVALCYDVEFPELARAAARAGVQVLAVPSCTDDRQGFLRVRYCAHARAVENQLYVIHAGTVGSLPSIPAVAFNYGQASILTPSDFEFARDGILAEGQPNLEMIVIGDLDLQKIFDSRTGGTVLPLFDSVNSAIVASRIKTVDLRT
jgi:predicted amidohydrolase